MKNFGRISVNSILNKNRFSSKIKIGSSVYSKNFDISNFAKDQQNIIIKLQNDSKLEISCNKQKTVGEICLEIATKIKMKRYLDFKLFLRMGQEERVLDEDELVLKILLGEEEDDDYFEEISKINILKKKFVRSINK